LGDWPVKLQQSQGTGAGNSFGASLHLELVKNNPIMAFDRTQGEEKSLANFFIRQPLRNELQDFQLALAQWFYQRRKDGG
jgi:hypothetical protein